LPTEMILLQKQHTNLQNEALAISVSSTEQGILGRATVQ